MSVDSFELIRRPADAVYELATNAALWSHWDPAAVAVSDTPPRPLRKGEQATATLRAGRRTIASTWTVLACDPPVLWVIATASAMGDARIVYELRADSPTLTRFFRTLSYRSARWPWTMFDANLARRALARQSDRAVANLRRVLEGRRS